MKNEIDELSILKGCFYEVKYNIYLAQLTTRSADVVSGQSFGSSAVNLACITFMCTVQRFPGGHSIRLAFGSFFYLNFPD